MWKEVICMWNKKVLFKKSILLLLIVIGVVFLFDCCFRRQKVEKDLKFYKDVAGVRNEGKAFELSTINIDKQGVYFYDTEWITNYAQVEGGHYYWLRYDDERYIIYRDNREKVGTFELPFSYDNDMYYSLDGFVKYGNEFYALIGHLDFDRNQDDIDVKEFARVNLEKEELDILYDVSKDNIAGDGKYLFCCIYQDYFYYDKRTIWQAYDKRPGISIRLPIKTGGDAEELESSLNVTKAKPYLLYADGKILYGVRADKKITLFYYDMKSGKEQEFFQFEEKKPSEEKPIVTMDKDNIYCMDYMISRKECSVFKALQKAKRNESGIPMYASNSKYVFYVDKKDSIHRLNKKTKKDKIIRRGEALDVSCTEKGLYVRVREIKGFDRCNDYNDMTDEDEANDFYADYLYYLDFDGKKQKVIWKGGYE